MKTNVNLTPPQLAGMIDHTFLKPFGPPEDIEKVCHEVAEYGSAMVVINPAEVEHCVRLLASTPVRVRTAIGFPLGQSTRAVKEYETKDAIQRGAGEIDTVINVRALQARQVELVMGEITDMVRACWSSGVICKVILETCYLTDEQKRQVCKMALQARADFVKTSTGFGPVGARLKDARLMWEAVEEKMGVKAAGGICSLDQALAMIEAGAACIGMSAGVAIVQEFQSRNQAENFPTTQSRD